MVDLLILAEEKTMKFFLEGFLPRFFPELEFLCLAFEGKKDLEKNIPNKMRGWTWAQTKFLIVRDNDGADCHALKQRLVDICPPERRERTTVRIICQELEAWYFGDPDGLADAFENESLREVASTQHFRKPDEIAQPSLALANLEPKFQKVGGARLVAKSIGRERNTSPSFGATMAAIEQV